MYLGKDTTQKPTISIVYIKIMSEDTNLVLTRTIPHKYAQLSQLTSKLLANTKPIMFPSKPLFPCAIPMVEYPILMGI